MLVTLVGLLAFWAWLAYITLEMLNFAVNIASAWLNILEKTQRFAFQHISLITLMTSVSC